MIPELFHFCAAAENKGTKKPCNLRKCGKIRSLKERRKTGGNVSLAVLTYFDLFITWIQNNSCKHENGEDCVLIILMSSLTLMRPDNICLLVPKLAYIILTWHSFFHDFVWIASAINKCIIASINVTAL